MPSARIQRQIDVLSAHGTEMDAGPLGAAFA